MESVSKHCLLVITIGLFILCVSAAAAQSGSHTTIQVYSDKEVLGHIVSITSNSGIGAYSITITRGMSVSPAHVGDILKDKDIITLQQGSFADIQLVDRSEKTMLGGSPGGTGILIKKAGSTFGTGAAPKATETDQTGDRVYVEPSYGGELGKITGIKGEAYIVRPTTGGEKRAIPATVSEGLMDGDILHVAKGYVVIELTDSRVLTVYEGKRLTLHEKVALNPESFLDPVINHPVVKQVSSFLDETWSYLKHVLAGESFEPKDLTATAGVRG